MTTMRTRMQGRTTVVYLASFATAISGFSINHHHARIPPCSSLKVTTYGRGAEIWPECNEAPIQLADSFPGGVIPDEVLITLSKITLPEDPSSTNEEKASILPEPIRRMFSRVSPEATTVDKRASLDKTPTVIAVALLASGLVRPLDIMISTSISGYLAVLYYWARSPRSDGLSPHVPAVPPQGHVPDLVANPLGLSFTNSNAYDSWLKVGAVLSLFAPLVAILRYTVFASQGTQMAAAKACSRPLFLLCCQALVESISRKVMAPLPLRILIPVVFNAARLAPLWLWAASPALALPGKLLAMANVLYWSANLFGFLIPTATMRYMRAYFLCVESEQVITRPGFESNVGMLP